MTAQQLKKTLLSVFLLATVCISAVVPAQTTPVRLAIIAPDEVSAPVADLLFAQLAEKDDVVLLERADVAKVLTEAQLVAMNATSLDERLQLGRILPVDLFVVVDHVTLEKGKDGLGIIVFSADSAEMYETELSWDKDPGAVMEAFLPIIETGIAKNLVPEQKRHYVALTGVRENSLAGGADGMGEALRLLLSRELGRIPSVRLLERGNLRLIGNEKELTEKALPLPGAVWLIECGFRNADGGWEMVARLQPAGETGNPPTVVKAQGSEAARTVQRLTAEIWRVLGHQSSGSVFGDPEKEAMSLLRQHEWLRAHGVQDENCRALAEAAYLLFPCDRALEALAYGENVETVIGKDVPEEDLIRRLQQVVLGRQISLYLERKKLGPLQALPAIFQNHVTFPENRKPELFPSVRVNNLETLISQDKALRKQQAYCWLEKKWREDPKKMKGAWIPDLSQRLPGWMEEAEVWARQYKDFLSFEMADKRAANFRWSCFLANLPKGIDQWKTAECAEVVAEMWEWMIRQENLVIALGGYSSNGVST